MRGGLRDTPPSSIDGDEISNMNEDGVMFLDDMEEVQLEDLIGDEDYTETELPEDHSKLIFNKHTGSIFACNFHPDGKIAVTGGEDDLAYVWSVETGNVVMKCEGHRDSVVFTEFSFDGTYLATADMSGVIKVWECQPEENTQLWPLVFEYDSDDIMLGLWHFGAQVLLIGTTVGDIYMMGIPTGETKFMQGYSVKIECAKLFPDGKRLAAGYHDGGLRIWDLKTCQTIHQIPANIHNDRVADLDIHPKTNLIVSISNQGKIVLIASNTGKVVSQLETDGGLEVVSFCKDPQMEYFAIGSLAGNLTIWDCSRQMMRHQCANASDGAAGVTKVLWIKEHLVTAGLDGAVTIYEGRSGAKCGVLTGHITEILDIAYNPKTNVLLTGSDDYTARIYSFDFK